METQSVKLVMAVLLALLASGCGVNREQWETCTTACNGVPEFADSDGSCRCESGERVTGDEAKRRKWIREQPVRERSKPNGNE